jgi:hypothetical protein
MGDMDALASLPRAPLRCAPEEQSPKEAAMAAAQSVDFGLPGVTGFFLVSDEFRRART